MTLTYNLTDLKVVLLAWTSYNITYDLTDLITKVVLLASTSYNINLWLD